MCSLPNVLQPTGSCRRFLSLAIAGLVLWAHLTRDAVAETAPTPRSKVFLILFGGQSNALGWGYQQYLEDNKDPLAAVQEDIDLYYAIAGEGYLPENTLIKLQSGTSNIGPKPGGHYPNLPVPVSRFGPELSLARTVKDRLAAPDAKVAIVKFAHGGTSLYDIADWRPNGTADKETDGKLYQIFQATVAGAIKALKEAYPDRDVEVLGIGWVQGESDALEGKGAEYEGHLTTFIKDVRATYGEQVVFALSQVSPNQYNYSKDPAWVDQWRLVAAAQEKVASALPKVRMTRTMGPQYGVSAGSAEGAFHFTSAALLQIGRDLGNAIAELSGMPIIDAQLAGPDYTVPTAMPGTGSSSGLAATSRGVDAKNVVVVEVGSSPKPTVTARFEAAVQVFNDREFVINEPPALLAGRPFIRGSIDKISFKVITGGRLFALTSEKGASITQREQLEAYGFKRVSDEPPYLLFGSNSWDRAVIYEKAVSPGEAYTFKKWVVIVGARAESAATRPAASMPARTEEEVLYNGIRLPVVWPPRARDPASREPMPVPYLANKPAVLPIDVGRQLFVDDFLVENTTMNRRFHVPVKYKDNPVLKPETALEKGENGLALAGPKSGGVWWDSQSGCFKMWYEAGWFGGIALAESRDGLHWKRPALNSGGPKRAPNEVTPPGVKPDSWTVILDPHPEAATRYKLFVREPGGSHMIPAKCYVSADGIEWGSATESGPMGDRSTAFYNPFREKWVYSIRSMYNGRARHYWESNEFPTGNVWTWDETDFWKGTGWKEGEPVVWVAADRLDLEDLEIKMVPQLYNLDAVAYESIVLGLFQIWRGPHNNQTNGTPKLTELSFGYSRDGFHWHRPDRTTAIPAERKSGAWDRGYLQSIGSICVVMGDELWFYYTGFAGDESRPKDGMYANGATGLAILRRDGFASFDADATTSYLTTRPVSFSGKNLFVNASATGGQLRAEVRDLNGLPIAPFTLGNSIPFSGDKTLVEMRWRGVEDLSSVVGRPVRFHFELAKGSLYSFWTSKDESGRSDGYLAGGGPGYTGLIDTIGRSAIASKSSFREGVLLGGGGKVTRIR
jgi:hypothetical protein